MRFGRYSLISPQDLLQNGWVIFGGVFLLTFAVVYYSLGKFFSSTKKVDWRGMLEGKKESVIVHPSAAIISFVIAFFTAATVSRQGIFYDYFTSILGVWMIFFVLIVMFILSLPFFKALKSNMGDKWYLGGIAGVGLAVAYWFFFRSYFFYDAFSYSFSSTSYHIYNFLSSGGGLFVLMVLLGFLGAVLPSKRNI